MLFRNEANAVQNLQNISYYRLKGYWWDMQSNIVNHAFNPGTYFEEVIARYNFDRHLRLILFDAIERIEIALRTKMIYHLSMSNGSQWFSDPTLFSDPIKHQDHLDHLRREFIYSKEIFALDHKRRYPQIDPEAWKIMEIASMGTLSKFYKNLNHQSPDKSTIAKEMGLNLHRELSSWLESIVYIRNIIAHNSRLWSRSMVKRPMDIIQNPIGLWFNSPLRDAQKKKPFLIISTLVYLCNQVSPNHQIKNKIIQLIGRSQNVLIYKLGFFNNGDQEPLWR